MKFGLFMLSLGLTYTTHLIIVFVGTFSSIIYFKQLCNKRSFLGTTTLEKKEQIKKEEERGIVWQCVWRDPRWFSCHCWLIFQESALWSALNHFDISSLLYTISGRLTIQPDYNTIMTVAAVCHSHSSIFYAICYSFNWIDLSNGVRKN